MPHLAARSSILPTTRSSDGGIYRDGRARRPDRLDRGVDRSTFARPARPSRSCNPRRGSRRPPPRSCAWRSNARGGWSTRLRALPRSPSSPPSSPLPHLPPRPPRRPSRRLRGNPLRRRNGRRHPSRPRRRRPRDAPRLRGSHHLLPRLPRHRRRPQPHHVRRRPPPVRLLLGLRTHADYRRSRRRRRRRRARPPHRSRTLVRRRRSHPRQRPLPQPNHHAHHRARTVRCGERVRGARLRRRRRSLCSWRSSRRRARVRLWGVQLRIRVWPPPRGGPHRRHGMAVRVPRVRWGWVDVVGDRVRRASGGGEAAEGADGGRGGGGGRVAVRGRFVGGGVLGGGVLGEVGGRVGSVDSASGASGGLVRSAAMDVPAARLAGVVSRVHQLGFLHPPVLAPRVPRLRVGIQPRRLGRRLGVALVSHRRI